MSSRLDGRAKPVAPAKPAARPRRQGGNVIEMQRRRVLGAALEVVGERGVRAASVAAICQRAGISRKTFYDSFADREACVLAAFEQAVQRIELVLSRAVAEQSGWRVRVRVGLAALLALLDREPALARLVAVEALAAGKPTVAARKRALDRAIALVDEGRAEARRGRSRAGTGEPPPLTAEGVVGAVLAIVQARLIDRDPRPLSGLSGPLTAIVVLPYLGAAAARREIDAPVQAPAEPADEDSERPVSENPFDGLPLRLTYRTVRVLASIAALGANGSSHPSGRQIATAAGVSDQGQMSRLLGRLERAGLVENTGGRPARGGEPKAWALTGRGERILRAIDGG